MVNLFIAPHNDDEALFGSYLIQRLKPLVFIVTDGVQHEEKFLIPIEQRRWESIDALKILGAYGVEFGGVSDTCFEKQTLMESILGAQDGPGIVLAPATEGGNPHHDLISEIVEECWGNSMIVLYYGTYSKGSDCPTGDFRINGTKDEQEKKHLALQCYKSQLKINPQFFEANDRGPEYISFNRKK